MFGLDVGLSLLLFLCIFCVCVFEFINGFHDTANAVATVIYTNTLKPQVAVIFSGILNGLGVLLGGTAVAVGIVSMLPVETLVDQKTAHSLSMVGAILLTAIFWNLGTWLLGIPCSSTHTLVGSILGCGVAYSLLPGTGDAAVNWSKASEVAASLLISPLFGFLLAILLMSILRWTVSNKRQIFSPPHGDEKPPFWIRLILISTCGLVSYSHGSNDGQKGIGLMMLVLIGIVPSYFAISDRYTNEELVYQLQETVAAYNTIAESEAGKSKTMIGVAVEKLKPEMQEIRDLIASNGSSAEKLERFEVRRHVLVLKDAIKKLQRKDPEGTTELEPLIATLSKFKGATEYAPVWVIALIALSLGIGTMIGWKRIVVTIGEKIGKTHLTYAQGASAELVAASTIAASTYLGLPVSTTQVLSSGIAGAMFASGGTANLQRGTIYKILLAWLLTFPVCLTMSGTLFLLFRYLFP
ncbi:MAG: inorganic phosphate transporter [Pirellula sp.]|jgi:phosphate/sulfate permease